MQNKQAVPRPGSASIYAMLALFAKSTTARSNQVANPDYISQTKNGMEKVNLTATQTMMVPVLHDTIISSYLTESKKEKKPETISKNNDCFFIGLKL